MRGVIRPTARARIERDLVRHRRAAGAERGRIRILASVGGVVDDGDEINLRQLDHVVHAEREPRNGQLEHKVLEVDAVVPHQELVGQVLVDEVEAAGHVFFSGGRNANAQKIARNESTSPTTSPMSSATSAASTN